MKPVLIPFLALAMAAASYAQEAQSMYPRHIEVPVYPYPQIARAARVSGEVAVKVTIDADGNVVHAEAVSGPPLLHKVSADNIQHWTFAKPPSGPYVQTVVYEYRIDYKATDGTPPTVSFDLPNRVTIVAAAATVQPSRY